MTSIKMDRTSIASITPTIASLTPTFVGPYCSRVASMRSTTSTYIDLPDYQSDYQSEYSVEDRVDGLFVSEDCCGHAEVLFALSAFFAALSIAVGYTTLTSYDDPKSAAVPVAIFVVLTFLSIGAGGYGFHCKHEAYLDRLADQYRASRSSLALEELDQISVINRAYLVG